jgi:glutamine amidotransferase
VKRWRLGAYAPIGSTDSEHAFCWLMDALRTRFAKPPSDRELAVAVAELARRLSGIGVFNMLLSDGRSLFCHCSTRLAWLTRRAPFGPATLVDEDLTVNFEQETTPQDVVTVVATRPLTRNEAWTVMEPGTTVVFRQGEPVPLPQRRAPRRATQVTRDKAA